MESRLWAEKRSYSVRASNVLDPRFSLGFPSEGGTPCLQNADID